MDIADAPPRADRPIGGAGDRSLAEERALAARGDLETVDAYPPRRRAAVNDSFQLGRLATHPRAQAGGRSVPRAYARLRTPARAERGVVEEERPVALSVEPSAATAAPERRAPGAGPAAGRPSGSPVPTALRVRFTEDPREAEARAQRRSRLRTGLAVALALVAIAAFLLAALTAFRR